MSHWKNKTFCKAHIGLCSMHCVTSSDLHSSAELDPQLWINKPRLRDQKEPILLVLGLLKQYESHGGCTMNTILRASNGCFIVMAGFLEGPDNCS